MFSWSRGQKTYDLGASDGDSPRSFISVLSEMTHSSDTCSGAADDDAGEGRMDSKRNAVNASFWERLNGRRGDGVLPERFSRLFN